MKNNAPNVILTITILTYVGYDMVIDDIMAIDESIGTNFYIGVLYSSPTLLSLALFFAIPYKNLKGKMLSALLFVLSLWGFLDHVVQCFLEGSEYHDIFRLYSLSAAVIIMLPLLFKAVGSNFEARKEDFDEYNNKDTFLAYKKPDNILGFFAALFGREPFGACCLVCEGYRFFFKRERFLLWGWKMAKTKHMHPEKMFHRKINKIPLAEADKATATAKGSIINNCYMYFRRFKKWNRKLAKPS